MKNKILFILCIAFTSTSIYAQTMSFGAKIGGNMATFNDLENADPKFGVNFGAVASVELSDVIALQPELFYSAQGFKREVDGLKSKAKIDYFHLPILISLKVVEGLSLQAGPQLGINIRKEIEVDGQENNSSQINVNDFEASAAFGLQYTSDANFFVQARYTMGLSEVFLNETAKSSVFSFSIGFFFDRL